MSQALERVIAEQQQQIDVLEAREKYSIEAWARENERRESLISALFMFLNHPDVPGTQDKVVEAIRAWGYCTICECSPCECEGQYD